jgi:predicted nuclease of predicted toxin-antitoxin system
MKIKLDENLPLSLVSTFAHLGHDADTVPDEGLSGKGDDTVWKAAQEAEWFLISQDLNFSDVRQFAPGSHFGVLVLRLKEPGRQALLERVQAIFSNEDVENWKRCFVVATEHKIRIRKPK